jgi:hypothetical protein
LHELFEHPEAVVERIQRYAGAVGRERVIAGAHCGFATFATLHTVDPETAGGSSKRSRKVRRSRHVDCGTNRKA